MRHWRRRRREGGTSSWHHVEAAEVRGAVLSTGYPDERVHLVEGRVEETLPGGAPAEIALLRLDTDWYESTKHELEHLYPRLSPGGVLILDDYGHYEGARRAVDEYFEAEGGRPLLSRIDYTGRIGVKRPAG
jgi:O-methyltransferase